MRQPLSRSKLMLCTAGLLGTAACIVSLDFNYSLLDQPVQIANSLGDNSVAAAIPFDLTQQADLESHKAQVETIALEGLDMTVSAVQGDNTVGTITAVLALRPDSAPDGSQDVPLANLVDFKIAANNTVHIGGTPQVDAFVLKLVKGTGKGSVVLTGSTAGGDFGDFALDFVFSMSMTYDAGIF